MSYVYSDPAAGVAPATDYPFSPRESTLIGKSTLTANPGSLADISERIAQITASVHDAASKLEKHADRLHGPNPVCDPASKPHEVRSGGIGALLDQLDELASLSDRLSAQANRNCSLV